MTKINGFKVWDEAYDTQHFTPQEIAERSAGNLLPVPWTEPEDTANLVLYLASDKARYATGSQFVLDAGLLSV